MTALIHAGCIVQQKQRASHRTAYSPDFIVGVTDIVEMHLVLCLPCLSGNLSQIPPVAEHSHQRWNYCTLFFFYSPTDNNFIQDSYNVNFDVKMFLQITVDFVDVFVKLNCFTH